MTLSHLRVTKGTEQDSADVPWPSLALAYAAFVPLAAGGVASWLVPAPWVGVAVRASVLWGSAVVCFLAGVRRGLSFRQPGGSTLGEVGTMFVLFVLGVAALFCPVAWAALVLLAAAYLLLAVGDTAAARHGEAPAYFARLRPVQMALPLASVAALLVRVVS